MLKIKLTRIGKKGQPQYRVVVQEGKSKISGEAKALLGYYNPLSQPPEFRLLTAEYDAWLARGARPTDTIRQLVKKFAPHIKPTNNKK